MTPQAEHHEKRLDMSSENRPAATGIPQRYLDMVPFEREVTWLLDQKRIHDAVVYFLVYGPAPTKLDIPFWQTNPQRKPSLDDVISKLLAERRITLVKGTHHEYRLGPNSGLEKILADVRFLRGSR